MSAIGERLLGFLHNVGDVLRGMTDRRAPCT
jgi:hypothetical protein